MPTEPFGDGRDERGRFTAGNVGGPGNPHAQQVGKLRSALLEAVRPEDLEAITRKLVELATGGDIAAARVILERTLGRPTEPDLLERIEALESRLLEVRP